MAPMRIRALPNYALKWFDFRPTFNHRGNICLVPPYPSRPNRTTKQFAEKSLEFPDLLQNAPMRWKNISYEFTPKLLPRPLRGSRWGGTIQRIVHDVTPEKHTSNK